MTDAMAGEAGPDGAAAKQKRDARRRARGGPRSGTIRSSAARRRGSPRSAASPSPDAGPDADSRRRGAAAADPDPDPDRDPDPDPRPRPPTPTAASTPRAERGGRERRLDGSRERRAPARRRARRRRGAARRTSPRAPGSPAARRRAARGARAPPARRSRQRLGDARRSRPPARAARAARPLRHGPALRASGSSRVRRAPLRDLVARRRSAASSAVPATRRRRWSSRTTPALVPWDAFVLRHALRRDHPAHRDLRPLLDDRECDLPVFGAAADPARRGPLERPSRPSASSRDGRRSSASSRRGAPVARKPWRERYRLAAVRPRRVREGRAPGAARPIVPCAIVGSEEASPGIARTGWLAERLGVPLLAGEPVAPRSAPRASCRSPRAGRSASASPSDLAGARSGRGGRPRRR